MKAFRNFGASAVVLAAGIALAAFAQQAPRSGEPIQPLPEKVTDVDPAKAALGARLFADSRLSGDGSVSCASCHHAEAGGADGKRFSVSAFGKVRPLNSPTIANVRYNSAGLNWTARTESLEKQISGSISNADTMAHSWAKVIELLSKDAEMTSAFKTAYGAAPTQENVSHAIISFERSQVTPSRFDDWLRGDDKAISATERLGYDKFKAYGCVGCHSGINVGGSMLQKFPLIGDYFGYRASKGRGELLDVDRGRFAVTKKDEDMFVFRVPTLRNVALTAPYLHDGSVPTLDEAILLMGRHQLGREIPPADRQAIEAFLNSLTGKALARQ
jgi:cytochrome c peroxidase